jgi:hypothetical protein
MEVDWAGTKIAFYDVEQEKMTEASLFVAVLPCSQLIFVNPYRDEKMPSCKVPPVVKTRISD